MKKLLLGMCILAMIIVLTGCGNEEKVTEVIDNYWLALSNRQYGLARTYCIPDGNNYRYAEHLEKEHDSTIRTTFVPSIIEWIQGGGIKGIGSTKVIVSFEIVITSTGILGMSATETAPGVEWLTKVNGVWKLE